MNILYENIRKRRVELNMSQQELAEAVGYSGKSMVSQVEHGMIDLPSTMITKFAEALNCTESYLMGWDDEPDIASIDPETLKRALAFVEKYEKASPEIQSAIRTLLGENQSDS